MAVVLGNIACLLPDPIIEECRKQGLPLDWVGKPNSFFSPSGPGPGRGWVLMAAGDVANINWAQTATLFFSDDNGPNIQLSNIIPIRATSVSPGAQNDPLGVYLVEVADIRHLASNEFYANPVNRQYNCRAPGANLNIGGPPATDSYYSSSLNAGALYTWQQIADDLWSNFSAITEFGSSPPLPFAPSGNPENLRFIEVSAWQAYNQFLFRIGCILGFSTAAPGAGVSPFAVYQIGVDTNSLATSQTKWRSSLMLDDYALEGFRAKIPASVDVVFHQVNQNYGAERTVTGGTAQWTSTPVHIENVTDPTNTPGTQAGAKAVIYDDMAAMIDHTGAVANQAAIASRANARAADYYRMIGIPGGGLMRQTYIGIINDLGFYPSGLVSGISFRDVGNGYLTSIVYAPPPLKVTDDTKWAFGTELLERLKPPDYNRASFPNYPDTKQIVKVTGATDQPHYFTGLLQVVDSVTRTFTDDEKCFVSPLSPTPDPAVGDYAFCRLAGLTTLAPQGGQAEQRPLYYLCCRRRSGGGPPLCVGQVQPECFCQWCLSFFPTDPCTVGSGLPCIWTTTSFGGVVNLTPNRATPCFYNGTAPGPNPYTLSLRYVGVNNPGGNWFLFAQRQDGTCGGIWKGNGPCCGPLSLPLTPGNYPPGCNMVQVVNFTTTDDCACCAAGTILVPCCPRCQPGTVCNCIPTTIYGTAHGSGVEGQTVVLTFSGAHNSWAGMITFSCPSPKKHNVIFFCMTDKKTGKSKFQFCFDGVLHDVVSTKCPPTFDVIGEPMPAVDQCAGGWYLEFTP